MCKAIGVDIYNFALTDGIGRCLSTAGGGLNEHIPIVIVINDNGKSNRSGFIQSMPYGKGGENIERNQI